MTDSKSFRVSDASIRDIPWAVAAFFILSIFSIALGILAGKLPDFWRGVLLGSGGGLIAAFFLLRPAPGKIDIGSLPQPSDRVMAICRDSGSSFVEAVKAYREESGVGLSESTAVLRHYQSQVKKTSE